MKSKGSFNNRPNRPKNGGMPRQASGNQKEWLYFALGSGSMLVIGAVTLITFSFLGKFTQISGTWKIETNFAPAGTPAITVVINNEGKITALNPTNNSEAIEVGKIIKVSDVVDLPKGTDLQANTFVNQATKAKQSEAKTYTGTMNKGQQAHFTEKSRWGRTLDDLGVGVKPESENYRYTIDTITSIKTLNASNDPGIAVNRGIAKNDGLKSYVGFVYLSGSTSDFYSLAILCESELPTTKESGLPKFDGREMKCPDGYILVGN